MEGKATSGTKGAGVTGLVDEIPPATNVVDELSPVVVDNSAPVIEEDQSTPVVVCNSVLVVITDESPAAAVKIESLLAVNCTGSTADGFTTGGAGAGVRAAGGVDAVELTDGLGDLATIGIDVDFTGVKGGGAITDCALSPQMGVGGDDVINGVGAKADEVLTIVGLVVEVVAGSKVVGAVRDRSEGVETTGAGMITDAVAGGVTSRETPCILEGTGPERAGIVGSAANFAVKADVDPFTIGVAPRAFTGIPAVELPSPFPDCAGSFALCEVIVASILCNKAAKG